MSDNIVKQALRSIVLADNFTTDFREECLDELIKVSMPEPTRPDLPVRDFEYYRRNHGRIDTIKYVRASLNVGLLEALIIVKGIESHYSIHD